ncbi:MAG: hypothetical protein ACKVT0_19145 [Planctomycetaceae bacterium]
MTFFFTYPCTFNGEDGHPATAETVLLQDQEYKNAVLLFGTEADVAEYLQSDASLPPLTHYGDEAPLRKMLEKEQKRGFRILAINPRHENDKIIVAGVLLIDNTISHLWRNERE